MLRNYLKTTLRKFIKNSAFTGINLFCLVLGTTTFLIILQFVWFERGYDRFHDNPNDLYRVATMRYAHGELISESAAAMPPLRRVMEAGLPEIESVTRIYNDGNAIVTYDRPGDRRVFNEDKAYYADETFFNIFNYPLIYGNAERVLEGTRQLVLSETTAKKYFGDEDPVGKTLNVTSQTSVDFIVTGVFSDPPKNAHFRPEILFSFRTYTEVVHPDWGVEQNWIWNDFYTYLRAPGTTAEAIGQRIDKLAHETWEEQYRSRDVNYQFYAQPIETIHTESHILKELSTNIDAEVLDWLFYIALVIILIAWVNYFNLSLTQCVQQVREIGVRKTFGASQLDVRKQIWLEHLIMNVGALGLSLSLFLLIQPLCSNLLGIYYPTEINVQLLVALLLLLMGGMISSSYPALFLARLRLLELVNGRFKAKPKGKMLIKGLLLFQMLATPLLMAATFLIQQQTSHLINQDLGVSQEQIVSIVAPRNVPSEAQSSRFDLFRNLISESGQVEELSVMTMLPGKPIDWYSNFQLIGDTTSQQYMNVNLVEYNFDRVLDMELITGRTFSNDFNDSLSLVINESAARLWGYEPEQIIGRTFRWGYSPTIPYFDKRVIGVVKDYQQHASSTEAEPIIFSLLRNTPADFAQKYFLVKLTGPTAGMTEAIRHIEQQWASTYPRDPFNYEFLDDSFARAFIKEQQMLSLVKAFGLVSIALAVLGLFGLSSLVAKQRIREIGIRKTLGAGIFNLVRLLSKDLLVIAGLAYVVALPIMFFMGRTWLQNYEIRVDLDFFYFLVPLLISLVLTLSGTISNSLRAAFKNPVDSLRHD